LQSRFVAGISNSSTTGAARAVAPRQPPSYYGSAGHDKSARARLCPPDVIWRGL